MVTIQIRDPAEQIVQQVEALLRDEPESWTHDHFDLVHRKVQIKVSISRHTVAVGGVDIETSRAQRKRLKAAHVRWLATMVTLRKPTMSVPRRRCDLDL